MQSDTTDASAMPPAAPACSEPPIASRRPVVAAAMASRVWRCRGSARNSRASNAVRKGVMPPYTISTLATGAAPNARMKAIMLPARAAALANSAPPLFRMSIQLARDCHSISGTTASSIRIERQKDTSHAGRSTRRTITPAVLNAAAAPMAQSAPSMLELSAFAGVFTGKPRRNWNRRAPVHRFPGPATLQATLPVVGARPADTVGIAAVVPVGYGAPYQRARLLPDGRPYRRHPARHARPSGGTDGQSAAGDPDPWPDRL